MLILFLLVGVSLVCSGLIAYKHRVIEQNIEVQIHTLEERLAANEKADKVDREEVDYFLTGKWK